MDTKAISLSGLIVAGLAISAGADDAGLGYTDFDKIKVSRGVTVHVTGGGEYRVRATARRGDITRLQLDVEGDTLHVSRKDGPKLGWGLISLFQQDDFLVEVSMPELESLMSLSGSHVVVANAGDALTDVVARSGARAEIHDVTAPVLTVSAASGSQVDIDGTCGLIAAKATLGSDLKASALACEVVQARASSGSNLSIRASRKATLRASSGGDVWLTGTAEVTDQRSSSGGHIRVN